MFGNPLKFDFMASEYIELKCIECGKETTHIVRSDHFECKECGRRND